MISSIMEIDLAISANWLADIIRTIFIFLDALVYTIIRLIFNVMIELANFDISGLYDDFERRIYVILGIFMIFKVTVSMLSYLVNPDKITDNQAGATKLITRIITSLVMLLMLPTFFNLALEFQNKLLPVLPRVIIGTANTMTSEQTDAVANNMTLSMLQGFASRRDGCEGDEEISGVWDMVDHINDRCEYQGKTAYTYQYLPLVSTVTGALMIYVISSLCISVAVRAFKLLILRVMAPLPVISYIDPKSAKDGMFSNWVKMFGQTWAELFINLGIIYLIVYLIDYLLSAKGIFNMSFPSPLIGVIYGAFLIIGLIFFASQAPGFITAALGIKNNNTFGKMLGMGAAALGGIGSAAAGFNASRAADTELGRTPNLFRNIGAGIAGGISGLYAGGAAASEAKDHNMRAALERQRTLNNRAIAGGASGSTFGGRMSSSLSSIFRGETIAAANQREIDAMGRDIADLEAQKNILSSIDSRVAGETVKKDWTRGTAGSYDANGVWDGLTNTQGEAIDGTINYKDFIAKKNAAAAAGESSFMIECFAEDGTRYQDEITMADAEYYQGLIQTSNENDYYIHASDVNDANRDTVLTGMVDEAHAQHVDGRYLNNGRKGYKDGKDNLQATITSSKRQKTEAERANETNKANDRFSGNNK